jgi:hypothetical protein
MTRVQTVIAGAIAGAFAAQLPLVIAGSKYDWEVPAVLSLALIIAYAGYVRITKRW